MNFGEGDRSLPAVRRHPVLGAILLCLVGLGLFPVTAGAAADGGLRAEISRLGTRHGFKVVGLDRIGDESAPAASGADLLERVEELLEGYNHAVTRDGRGGIETVYIYSRISAAPPRNVVNTRREGLHHLVDSEIVGPRGARRRVALVIDTGATSVVLPVSMIPRLGFRAEELRDGLAQTGNGKVAAKAGTLRSLTLGTTVVYDVAVTFLPDEGLGGRKLLGMEVLSRYRVVIDDANNRITLLPR